jgi:hypothetical protein
VGRATVYRALDRAKAKGDAHRDAGRAGRLNERTPASVMLGGGHHRDEAVVARCHATRRSLFTPVRRPR